MFELVQIFPWWVFCIVLTLSATTFGILMKYLGEEVSPNLVGIIFTTTSIIILLSICYFEYGFSNFENMSKASVIYAICAGLSYVGVDMAIIFMYRNQAPISLAMPVVRAGLALCTAIIGVIFFAEDLSLFKTLGVLLTVIGIVLVVPFKKEKET
ncbi:MAG: hypothetical protein CMP22_00735 [Rickettsiales bacterium]|nr:hypothetical protein [Rickettsiales bacterium]